MIRALLLFFVALAATAADAPPDPNACSACHLDEGQGGHAEPQSDSCLTCHPAGDSIPVVGHVALRTIGEAECAECHPSKPSAVPHPPHAEGKCLSCHNPHDKGKKPEHLWSRDEAVTCNTCHEPVDQTRFVHTVVSLGWCRECHDEHGGTEANLLTGGNNGSCARCHPAETAPNTHDHWPAASGQCDSCHDPHGSDNPYNLRLPVVQTCYQCHPAKNTGVQVHSAVVLGRCSTCHDPHGSEQDRKLRATPVSEVCFRCHADDVSGRKIVHEPVAEGQCIMCHDPHTTDYPKNLRTPVNVTCTMCHPEKDRTGVMTPHPAVETYGCTVCHDPHAGDIQFRLRKPIVELCTTCHAGYDDGFHVVQRPAGGGHPIGGLDDPLRPGRELVCTSCHDPHGTENPRMWYRAYQRLALCVECHRKTLAPNSKPGESIFEIEAEAARARAKAEKEAP